MTPLLTGTDADRARAVVAEIADALRAGHAADADPGLAGMDVGRGAAGVALLFAELHAENGAQADMDTAFAFLDSAMEQAADEERPNALLYPGTVGVGWILAYLEGSLVDPDPEPNDVDQLVNDALALAGWPSSDLIRGVTGAGLYLLERGQPAAPAVERLQAMATTTDHGVTWWVDPETCLPDRRALYPEGYYDVGMAHGQAGTIALLAHLTANKTAGARDLLRAATDWLLAQRLPDGIGPGYYPAIVAPDDRERYGARLAWCYGDPGVAVALLAAGQALDDDALIDEARTVALGCTERGIEHASVNDAPLCHGAAGLLHLFRRLHQGLGDETLAKAARQWFDVTIAMQRKGEPVAGYGSVRPDDAGVLDYTPLGGFLEGAVGVGLALLAATSERDPAWDSLLLAKPVA